MTSILRLTDRSVVGHAQSVVIMAKGGFAMTCLAILLPLLAIFSGVVNCERITDRVALGANDCASFSFDFNRQGFNYDIYISGFESDECKPSQFRLGAH